MQVNMVRLQSAKSDIDAFAEGVKFAPTMMFWVFAFGIKEAALLLQLMLPGFTNARGGGSFSAANSAAKVKAFLLGILLYFVAVAVVYVIGTSGIINNIQINTQIKNAAYNMAILGSVIGLIGGVLFLTSILGG